MAQNKKNIKTRKIRATIYFKILLVVFIANMFLFPLG